jgi:hypothetical protein
MIVKLLSCCRSTLRQVLEAIQNLSALAHDELMSIHHRNQSSALSIEDSIEKRARDLSQRATHQIKALKRENRLTEAKLQRYRLIAQECEAKRPDLFKGFGSAF